MHGIMGSTIIATSSMYAVLLSKLLAMSMLDKEWTKVYY